MPLLQLCLRRGAALGCQGRAEHCLHEALLARAWRATARVDRVDGSRVDGSPGCGQHRFGISHFGVAPVLEPIVVGLLPPSKFGFWPLLGFPARCPFAVSFLGGGFP